MHLSLGFRGTLRHKTVSAIAYCEPSKERRFANPLVLWITPLSDNAAFGTT